MSRKPLLLSLSIVLASVVPSVLPAQEQGAKEIAEAAWNHWVQKGEFGTIDSPEALEVLWLQGVKPALEDPVNELAWKFNGKNVTNQARVYAGQALGSEWVQTLFGSLQDYPEAWGDGKPDVVLETIEICNDDIIRYQPDVAEMKVLTSTPDRIYAITVSLRAFSQYDGFSAPNSKPFAGTFFNVLKDQALAGTNGVASLAAAVVLKEMGLVAAADVDPFLNECAKSVDAETRALAQELLQSETTTSVLKATSRGTSRAERVLLSKTTGKPMVRDLDAKVWGESMRIDELDGNRDLVKRAIEKGWEAAKRGARKFK